MKKVEIMRGEVQHFARRLASLSLPVPLGSARCPAVFAILLSNSSHDAREQRVPAREAEFASHMELAELVVTKEHLCSQGDGVRHRMRRWVRC